GLRSNVVGWWASHPAEPINGTVVTNAFGGVRFDPQKGWIVPKGAIHLQERGAELARFKVFPNELTEAHILPFIPDAAKIDQKKDKRLTSFAKILSDNASVHAVATALMESEPWDFTAVYYDGIDHFSHAFMPYHPPRLEWIKEEDFAMYKDVVKGAYRFHDMMLERLLDLAPTVVTLFELPIGQDMDGRPLLEAFEQIPEVKTIPSWESVEGESGMHTGEQQLDPSQARELMHQFAALGYIEDPGADKEKATESADIEGKYNVARTLLWKGQPETARRLLEDIV